MTKKGRRIRHCDCRVATLLAMTVKQSSVPLFEEATAFLLDCFVACAPRNDGEAIQRSPF
jgi:hypothetical protein